MEVLLKNNERRGRYRRHSSEGIASLTPIRLRLLRYVAEYGIVSLPQLARLASPSPKSARRHMRVLFDTGLVEIVPVPRAALADPELPNDASLLFGSAPNIYTVTRQGRMVLSRCGLADEINTVPRFGPRNSLFLAHELAIRDVRVWLEISARENQGHEVIRWQDGAEAEIDLKRSRNPKVVRPDSWFVYRSGEKVLVGLVEVDRGTERGSKRWFEKLTAYRALFQDGALKAATGYAIARVLVLTPNSHRRDRLSDFIQAQTSETFAQCFWLTDRHAMFQPSITKDVWRKPGNRILLPMLSVSNPPAIPKDSR